MLLRIIKPSVIVIIICSNDHSPTSRSSWSYNWLLILIFVIIALLGFCPTLVFRWSKHLSSGWSIYSWSIAFYASLPWNILLSSVIIITILWYYCLVWILQLGQRAIQLLLSIVLTECSRIIVPTFFMTRCTFWRLNPVRLGSHKLSYQLGCQIWVKLLIFLHWVLYLWTYHIFLGLLVRSLFYPLLRLNLILFLFMWHPTTFYSLPIWWLNVGCFRHCSLQFNLLLH